MACQIGHTRWLSAYSRRDLCRACRGIGRASVPLRPDVRSVLLRVLPGLSPRIESHPPPLGEKNKNTSFLLIASFRSYRQPAPPTEKDMYVLELVNPLRRLRGMTRSAACKITPFIGGTGWSGVLLLSFVKYNQSRCRRPTAA